MKNKIKLCVVLYFLIVLNAFSQSALSNKEILSFQAKGTYIFASNTDEFQYKNSPGFAGSAHFDFGRYVGVFLDLNTHFFQRENNSFAYYKTETSETVTNFSAGLKVNLYKVHRQSVIYVKAGVGGSHRINFKNFTLNPGVGFKYNISKNVYMCGETDGLIHFDINPGGGNNQKAEILFGFGIGVYLK